MKSEHSTEVLCKTLKVSRSGFYEWREKQSPQADTEAELKARVTQLFHESHCTYGFRSICKDLRDEGVPIGRKRVRRLMRQLGLHATLQRPSPYGKAREALEARACKHRLHRNFKVKRRDRIWTGDITYIWTRKGWVYLAVVLDLFSRKVVGFAVSDKPDTALVLTALSKAVRDRSYRRWRLMFHSDQGCQYTSQEFRHYLRDRGILQSMSRRGQCWDNAVSESFFGTLKRETGISRWPLENITEVQEAVYDWIVTWYNLKRRHTSLDYCSPVEFESKMAA